MANLKKNALSVIDSVTLAIAGSAPSYSLNASTVLLIGSVGLSRAASLIYGAIPMFGIAFAFMYLNYWRADAGAAYTWVGRLLNPSLGFMSAWVFLVLNTIFTVAASLPAGVLTLHLIAPQYEENLFISSIAGGFWFVLVALLTFFGVSIVAQFQRWMTGMEIVVLLALIISGLIKYTVNPVHPFSWSWFSPTSFSDFQSFNAGIIISMFYYIGWDVSSNVAEETKNSNNVAGFSGILGMVVVFLLFVCMHIIIQMGFDFPAIQNNSADFLSVMGDALFPHPWGNVAILAVLISTIGTIETNLIQSVRLLFSMGRDCVIDPLFEEIHPRFQTPWLACLINTVWGLSVIFISSSDKSIWNVMKNIIDSIGIMTALYYGMTGITCAWYYRYTLRSNWRTLFMQGVWPLSSAIILLIVGLVQLIKLKFNISLYVIGSILIGILPMLYYRYKYKSSFYCEPMEYHHKGVGSRE